MPDKRARAVGSDGGVGAPGCVRRGGCDGAGPAGATLNVERGVAVPRTGVAHCGLGVGRLLGVCGLAGIAVEAEAEAHALARRVDADHTGLDNLPL